MTPADKLSQCNNKTQRKFTASRDSNELSQLTSSLVGSVENTQRRHCGVSVKHDRTGATEKKAFLAQETGDGGQKT